MPLRNLPVAIPQDAADLPNAARARRSSIWLPRRTLTCWRFRFTSGALRHLTDRTDALLAFVARFPNPRPLLLVAEQDFGKALGMLLRPQLHTFRWRSSMR